jgi:hypothetical protein
MGSEQAELDFRLDDDSKPTETMRALDELFLLARQFSSRNEYRELLEFISRFRAYSPFNGMLIRVQMQGAVYVAAPSRWSREYGRSIRPGARPIAILQPRGPVMFVFDVSDTVPEANAPELPKEVTDPFRVTGASAAKQLATTIRNVVRDGVRVCFPDYGSQLAGKIGRSSSHEYMPFKFMSAGKPQKVQVPVRYDLFLSAKASAEEQYATLVHELAHLYCGHLGTPRHQWWPSRIAFGSQIEECEAESISYLVCSRLGVETTSAAYLSGYLSQAGEVPNISLDLVMKAAGAIYDMGQRSLEPRKEPKS